MPCGSLAVSIKCWKSSKVPRGGRGVNDVRASDDRRPEPSARPPFAKRTEPKKSGSDGLCPRTKTCEAIRGIIEEGQEVMKEFKGKPALDAGLLAAAQTVEHYEVANGTPFERRRGWLVLMEPSKGFWR
jgi:hypothetical protein